MKKKYTLGLLSILPISATFAFISCSEKDEELKRENTNQSINYSQYGIPKLDNIKIRTLIYPAARGENKMDANGVFTFNLHESPLKGVEGEWSAFATEVKSLDDNTLVEPKVIKKVTATADASAKYPLIFKWDNEQKLEEGKAYTFIFWKNDGSEKIVFKTKYINSSRDTFLAQKSSK